MSSFAAEAGSLLAVHPAATVTDQEELASDVCSEINSRARWEAAMSYYHKSCSTLRDSRLTDAPCCINAVIDVSGSMEGTKIIAVKLGLCSLVANLKDDDEVNLTVFATLSRSVTGGFQLVSELRPQLPALLESMYTEDSTAFYDATIKAIEDLAAHRRSSALGVATKNVIVALTDGEDNKSRLTSDQVLRHLCSPNVFPFMFVIVAVAMRPNEERNFRAWSELSHCKQISVSVKTGTRLVGIFKENLLGRIFQSDISSQRFLQENAAPLIVHVEALNDIEFTTLQSQLGRSALARIADSSSPYVPDRDVLSRGVSLCESMSDGSDEFDGIRIRRNSRTSCSDSGSGSDSEDEMFDYLGDEPTHGASRIVLDDDIVTARLHPPEFYCPISLALMKDPVICSDGHTYERRAIELWFQTHDTSPMTNVILPSKSLIPNLAMKNLSDKL